MSRARKIQGIVRDCNPVTMMLGNAMKTQEMFFSGGCNYCRCKQYNLGRSIWAVKFLITTPNFKENVYCRKQINSHKMKNNDKNKNKCHFMASTYVYF